ncbi:MAG: hypothetical protein LAT55_06125 [Opitutales bacterium]|nr:hypothetical protein [Opitutales bacterium]
MTKETSPHSKENDEQPLPPNQVTKPLTPPDHTDTLRPNPKELLNGAPISLARLKKFAGQNILSVDDFTREDVIEFARFAAFLEAVEIAPYHPLDGKIVITAFFEASTRTRTSFESATLRLDGKIISIPDAAITGVKKGESIGDIGEMFNAYGDAVIMRHTETEALKEILGNLRIPLINAGNGSGEHPTQALTDWYALLKWRPNLAQPFAGDPAERLHLGIMGTPGTMRAVKSFLLMSLLFKDHLRKVTIVSEMADPLGPELKDAITDSGIEFEVQADMSAIVNDLDVVYMNSIALLGGSYRTMDRKYKLNAQSELKPSAVILHPLARLDELDKSLDETAHNLYFTQAHGSVFVRQALLLAVLDRFHRLPENSPLQ